MDKIISNELQGGWLEDRFELEDTVSWQEIYPTLARRPFRLSHSTLGTIHTCERKYQLLKLLNIQGQEIEHDSKLNNVNLDYGSAFGVGIQTYIITNSLEQAIWEMVKSYNFAMESQTKNALSLVAGLQAFAAKWDAGIWEVVHYKGKPAAELSFKIILDSETQDYYCGYVDLVLRNLISGEVIIVEIKTTGLKLEDIRPLYQNSGQALGYSVILGSIELERASWSVFYIVNQLKGSNILPKIHSISFTKTLKDRLSWLLDLKIDYERLMVLEEIDHWPMRGASCLHWNRPCNLLGICDLVSLETQEARIKEEEDWDFVFTLEELIESSSQVR